MRCSLEEQISDLTAELTQMRQEVDKYSDEKRKHEDELATVKQVRKLMILYLKDLNVCRFGRLGK